jgi:nicotinamide-nucleotide amidase
MPEPDFCVEETLVAHARELIDDLKRLGLTVVTAESCTGGLVAALLSQTQDASHCLQGGFVAYTKHQKTKALDVSARLLAESGSVHPDVALQMAQGALAYSDASIGVAITGVLGPDPDEDGNPPGLVYFATAHRSGPARVVREQFNGGDPDKIRRRVILRAFELVREAASA